LSRFRADSGQRRKSLDGPVDRLDVHVRGLRHARQLHAAGEGCDLLGRQLLRFG